MVNLSTQLALGSPCLYLLRLEAQAFRGIGSEPTQHFSTVPSFQALSRFPLGLEHFLFTMKGLGVSVLMSIYYVSKRLYSEERKTHIPPAGPKPTHKRTIVCAHRLPPGPSLMLTERVLH